MPMTEPSMTEMALYKMCREVLNQYQAQHAHQFSESLKDLHNAVESYLQITVDEFDNEVIVTFVLKRSDLNGGN